MTVYPAVVSWIDLVIAALVILAALRGRSVGAFRQVGNMLGLLTGFIAGAWVAPWVASFVHGGVARPLVAIGVLIACTALGAALGRALGGAGNLSMRRLRLGALDASVGAAVGGVGSLVACWLLAGVLVNTSWGVVAGGIQGSKILTGLDAVMPPVPAVEAQIGALVQGADFPSVFAEVVAPSLPSSRVPSLAAATVNARGASSSVVKVYAFGACGGTLEGTGFFVISTLVLTNAHVIVGANTVTAQGHATTVVAFDPKLDVAVLRVARPVTRWLSFGSEPRTGSPVGVLGYPLDGGQTVTPGAFDGSIVASGRDIYNQALVNRTVDVLAAAVQHGNSGSPVLVGGRVIAMVFSRDAAGATTYAIPVSELRHVLANGVTGVAVTTGTCTQNHQ